VCRFSAVAAVALLCGCYVNEGVPPPDDQLFFPSGMLMDPRPLPDGTDPDTPRRWLFVSNSNSDRNFAGGTLALVDLQAFWESWYDEDTGAFRPYCGDDDKPPTPCVQPPGAPVDEDRPCRHMAQLPQVIECDETQFVRDTVQVGNFGTRIAASNVGARDMILWLPVRSDPSIVWLDVKLPEGNGELPSDPDVFSCDQDQDGRCGSAHRLTHRFNDPDEARLKREPFNILVDEYTGENVPEDQRYSYAYVAHAGGGDFTRINVDYQNGEDHEIVEQLGLFSLPGFVPGGFGLAKRPCFEAGEGPLGMADMEPNVPNLTKGCSRPLMYASYRFLRGLMSFTITPLEEFGQGATGLRAVTAPIAMGGLDPGPSFGGPVLGDIAFGDPRGDRLYVVQTNPGALVQMDTSLAFDGEPEDIPAAPPIELCQQPTSMVVHDDGVERLAFVACFRSAYIFVVDLNAFRVIASILGGTGPHALAVDAERGALYTSNTLESSLSVIDISRERKTRFTEIARIGLSDPFGQ
jgi:hypothetical protein